MLTKRTTINRKSLFSKEAALMAKTEIEWRAQQWKVLTQILPPLPINTNDQCPNPFPNTPQKPFEDPKKVSD